MLLGIFGAGGFGREIMSMATLAAAAVGDEDVCFVEPKEQNAVFGHGVISEADFFKALDFKAFNVAIARPEMRRKVTERCLPHEVPPMSIRSPHAIVEHPAGLGQGDIVCHFAVIGPGVTAGQFVHVNLHCYIGHDCQIGDFVTFSPGVRCGGNVTIGNGAFIGMGACIKQGLHIGAGVTIAMGAAVTKDVAAGVPVAGVPARLLG